MTNVTAAPADAPHVELRGVTKRYGAVTAITDLNLTVPKGSFTALLGPSGCGKSTLLRMIAGLEQISQGECFIDGVNVTNMPPAQRRIAMVFQSYALYPHMTVRQNIAFSMSIAGASRKAQDERTNEVARILQLEPYLDRRPAELSGGQRQRVAIGRALVRKPAVFLFDEPLSNLDAKLRVQMRLELAKLHADLAATMIYVTHDQTEAMTLADQIVVLDRGTISQIGSPLELYNAPANKFVATFIGSPSMNFIPGRDLVVQQRLGEIGASGRPDNVGPARVGLGREQRRRTRGEARAFPYLAAERPRRVIPGDGVDRRASWKRNNPICRHARRPGDRRRQGRSCRAARRRRSAGDR